MSAAPGGSWRVHRAGANATLNDYYEYLNLGNEIKEIVDQMRLGIRAEVEAQSAPKTAVTCPWCGATTFPDDKGCCEYCGGAVNA